MKNIYSLSIIAALLIFAACNNNPAPTNSSSTAITKRDTIGTWIDTLAPKWDTVLTKMIIRSQVGDVVKTDTVFTRRAIKTGK